MRIHANNLTLNDIYAAVNDLPGVYVTVSQHGSRTHKAAFEVSLEGNGYRKNTGTSGAGDEIGATWDEWGVFIARVFDADPNAVFGSVSAPIYSDGYTFHLTTNDRFESLSLPDDTHKRHAWEWTAQGATCKKCSARVIRG